MVRSPVNKVNLSEIAAAEKGRQFKYHLSFFFFFLSLLNLYVCMAIIYIFVLIYIDFIYIDNTQPDYFNVMNDLILWWPKIKSGGIIAGHDFEQNRSNYFLVIIAVTEFARKMGLHVFSTGEIGLDNASFYIFKP